MKKIFLSLFLSLYLTMNLHAILPDGATFEHGKSEVYGNYTYFITEDDGQYGEHSTKCIGGTLYFMNYNGVLTTSHNPLTRLPYYCSVKILKSNDKAFFVKKQDIYILTIHHKYGTE